MDPPDSSPPRIDRRLALKWIAGAAASFPALSEVSFGAPNSPPAPVFATGYGPDPDIIREYRPGDLWPLTFSDEQRRIVIALCDIIIPADEKSPSASSVGVHDFIDEWISSPYPEQARDRKTILKGLAWLDDEAKGRGEAGGYVSLDQKEQTEICRELAKAVKDDAKKHPGSFFLRMRDLVAGGYYTTPAGMKDLGYRGNVAMAGWAGPPPEVLERLGLAAQ